MYARKLNSLTIRQHLSFYLVGFLVATPIGVALIAYGLSHGSDRNTNYIGLGAVIGGLISIATNIIAEFHLYRKKNEELETELRRIEASVEKLRKKKVI